MDDKVGIINSEKDECTKKSVAVVVGNGGIEKMLEICREGLKDPTITQDYNYLGIIKNEIKGDSHGN